MILLEVVLTELLGPIVIPSNTLKVTIGFQALCQESEVIFGGRQGPYRSPVEWLT